jgi:hypothetical protein
MLDPMEGLFLGTSSRQLHYSILFFFKKVCDHNRFFGFVSTDVLDRDLRYRVAMLHREIESTPRSPE